MLRADQKLRRCYELMQDRNMLSHRAREAQSSLAKAAMPLAVRLVRGNVRVHDTSASPSIPYHTIWALASWTLGGTKFFQTIGIRNKAREPNRPCGSLTHANAYGRGHTQGTPEVQIMRDAWTSHRNLEQSLKRLF